MAAFFIKLIRVYTRALPLELTDTWEAQLAQSPGQYQVAWVWGVVDLMENQENQGVSSYQKLEV